MADDQNDNEGELETTTGRGDADGDDGHDDDEGDAQTPAEEQDDGTAEAKSSTASGAARSGVERPTKSVSERGTAGARLAAAKAVKAARKAAAKAQREAESQTDDEDGSVLPVAQAAPASDPVEAARETAVGKAATRAGEWAQANRPVAVGTFVAVLLALVGWFGWSAYSGQQRRAAGAALASAVTIANAEIRSDGESGTTDDDAPTFASVQARGEAALEAFRGVLSQHAGTEAARWARLGEARALLELGQESEARASYETALREAGSDPNIAWRAIEGAGFTFEVAEQWQQAIDEYEDLRTVESGAFAAAADYHIARMHMRMGQTDEATTELRALVERVQSAAEGTEPEFPYVLAQAEVRLRELDPSSATSEAPAMIGPAGAPGGLPPGLEGMPPEILEQLRRQLGQQAGGGGAGMPMVPGAGAGEGE